MRKVSIQMIFLIVMITVINYFDRSAISYAILPIQKDLNLNDVQFGAIGSGLGIGYLFMTLFGGILVDKYGSIKVWAIGAFFWSAVTICMGFAQGFASFFCLRILLGIAEGIHFPALIKTVADWLDVKSRARFLSFSLLGVPLSSVLGAPLITYLIEAASWRSMFYILGALGLIWCVLWRLFFRGRENPHLSTVHLSGKVKKIHWKTYLKSKPLIANCAIYFIFGYILFFGLNWLPGYLEKTHQLGLTEAGFLLTLPWIAASLFVVAGGYVSDYLMKKTHSVRIARTYPIGLGLLLTTISFFFLPYTENLSVQLVLLSLGFGFAFSINAPIYALNTDLFPTHPATAQGIISVFFAIAGIISPLLTGWLVQTSHHFYSAMFFVSGLSLLGSLIAFFLQHPDRTAFHKQNG